MFFMKKRSKLLLASLLLMCSSGLQAQTSCVVVEQTDGTKTEFLLTCEPRIRYAADVVTLTSTDATLELPVDVVKKVYLSETNEDLNDLRSTQQTATARVRLTADALLMSGLAAACPVTVYSADGRLLRSQNANPDGTLSLSLSRLPQGMLIIKTNNQSFKLIRK